MSNQLTARHDPFLLVQSSSGGPLVLQPRRWRDTVLARWAAPWLDGQIARGVAPETSRLLAARAAALVEPRERHALADTWARLLAPRRSLAGLDARVPVARGNLGGAVEEIHDLIDALRDPSPVAARAVARVRVLLTDGTGPVYREGLSLRSAVAELVADLQGT